MLAYVCSHMIEATLERYFHIIERKPRGGTVLMPIFGSSCLDQSILDSAEGLSCISSLAVAETRLIDEGLIPSNNVVIVAIPRPLPISILASLAMRRPPKPRFEPLRNLKRGWRWLLGAD